MNGNQQNKYENYQLATNWNESLNDGPSEASKYILVDHAIRAIKLLYGQSLDDNNPDMMSLPVGWGQANQVLVENWIQPEKLENNRVAKMELGILSTFNNPDNENENQEDHDEEDEE